ncbi:MAG: radical SAM protein [Streptosporangiaceae bacterium]
MIAVPHTTAVSLPITAGTSPQTVKVRTGPDGVHLFDRRSGLNVLFDEALVPENRWSRAPRQVSIALTNACDLACEYCYAPKHPAVLDSDRLLSWARELDAEGCLGIGFGGGEPTLYRRLPRLCRSITETTSLAVTLTTHGHRWTPELVEQLGGFVHFVRVSVDGVGGTYEKLRDRSFADLLQRLELISGAFSFGINCVVNQRTLSELDAVAALAADFGAAELLLLLEQPTPSTPGANADVATGLRDWIRGHQGSVRLATGEQDANGLPTARPLPGEVGLRSYAHIDASGSLRATSYSSNRVPIDDRGLLAAVERLQQEETT